MSDELNEDVRKAIARAVSAATDAIRTELAAIKEAAHDGKLDEYLQGKRERARRAELN